MPSRFPKPCFGKKRFPYIALSDLFLYISASNYNILFMPMTSFTFHYRPSLRRGYHPGKLFIRVIRGRKSSNIATEYSLYPDEWDSRSHSVVIRPEFPGDTECRNRLSAIAEAMSNDLVRLRDIISTLELSGDYGACDVSSRFCVSLIRGTISGYAELKARRLCEEGHVRTARAYCCAARSLMNFCNGRDIGLSEIDSELMRDYESYLFAKGLKMNTVSFYMRTLRALYYRALKDHLTAPKAENPFAGVHTGVYRTNRRSLKSGQLKNLSRLEETLAAAANLSSATAHGRDVRLLDALYYFMFCYYARGMSFVDMAHLKKQDIHGGYISYVRCKTGGQMEVKVVREMKHILSYFSGRVKGSGYVFPIIRDGMEKTDALRQYETALKQQNVLLKELAAMAGIRETLSTHVARHTWATLAKRMEYSVTVISEALGHQDVKTTAIYLASFERSTMDELSMKMSVVARSA